jgi:hypothetical protein
VSADTPRADAINTRGAERVKIDAFVKVVGADREYVLRTRDLSRKGLFLYTKVGHVLPFKVGSTLSLELYDYDSTVSCNVVVVRVVQPGSEEAERYPAGFGCRIVDLDERNEAQLTSMLERVARTGEDPY